MGRVPVSTWSPGHVWAGGQVSSTSQGHQGLGEAKPLATASVQDIPAPDLLPGPGRPCVQLRSEQVGGVNGQWVLSGRLGSTKLKGWQLGMWPGDASLSKHRIEALPAPLTPSRCQII